MTEPNLSNIDAMARGNEVFKLKLIDVVKEELPEEIAEFENYLATNNIDLAADQVHKLKHKIALLGMEDAYEIAEAFEDELRADNKNQVAIFRGILKKMTKFLLQL